MSNPILDVTCCGCAACALICPKHAITMGTEERGFYAPSVDSSKCIDCKLCEKVCTVFNDRQIPGRKELGKEKVYIAVAKDRTILNNSASGGMGFVFAKTAIREDMLACGVGYNFEKNCAEHRLVKNEQELSFIQGSKYLQSQCEPAFRKMIEAGSGVVFGTPCQMAALDSVLRLKGKRDNYVLVDLFCHGVPPQQLWDNHIKWIKESRDHKANRMSASMSIKFRNKKDYILSLTDDGSDKIYYNAWYNEDAYYTIFLQGWMMNKSCHNCTFRRTSCADLRIGDCMAEKYKKLPYSPSCIVVDTEKGETFLQKCMTDIEIYSEDYSVIDAIQQKDNISIPQHYEDWYGRIMNGETPEALIHSEMRIKRMKSLIKNRILHRFIQNRASLENLAGEERRINNSV